MSPLLVIEDDVRVADFLARGLKTEGYTVSVSRNGVAGLELARAEPFAAIILDLMLPGMGGQEVCRSLRESGDVTPILMLTALDAIEDKVSGFRLGADDYLTKPFSFEELVARLDALIRRNRSFEVRASRLEAGELALDRDAVTVTRAGARIELTAKEFALLELLLSAPGKVFSRTRILNSVWGYNADPLTNVVDVYMRRLRLKLDDRNAEILVTVRGHGYKLEPLSSP